MGVDNKQLQDGFFENLQVQGVVVHVYLINGIKLTGTIVGYDKFSILLNGKGIHQLVYKHAIATTVPTVT